MTATKRHLSILLSALHVDGIGGVQTWMQAVSTRLQQLGHVTSVSAQSMMPYDLGILANWRRTHAIAPHCTRILLVSHGIIDLERPTDGIVGRAKLAAVSEEVRDHWQMGAYCPIVRQPIDTDFWRPDPSVERHRAGIVRYGYYRGMEWLPAWAESKGYQFTHVTDASPDTARDLIQRAAVVLASGRGALEAASCGTPVVVADHRHYNGGPLGYPHIELGRTHNYSGRGGVEPTPEVLGAWIESARDCPPDYWRDYVHTYHDARMITRQLLAAAGV